MGTSVEMREVTEGFMPLGKTQVAATYDTKPLGFLQLTNIPRKDETVWIDLANRERREFTVVEVIHSVVHDQVCLLLREL
jgi:hypothetical protein